MLSPMMSCDPFRTQASTSKPLLYCPKCHVNLGDDSFNGWGVTVVDSLDTMLLMGLKDEYSRAIPMITAANFSLPTVCSLQLMSHAALLTLLECQCTFLRNGHSLFGWSFVCLRALHGRYFARQSRRTRNKAFPCLQYVQWIPPIRGQHLQVRTSLFLLTLIDIPSSYSGDPGSRWTPGVLAEIASFQMEYAYLGKITGKKTHVDRVSVVLLHVLAIALTTLF